MIDSTMIENSISLLLSTKYPDADIFFRNATQTKENKPTFVINVDLQATPANKDYLQKDLVVVVQYFENDKIEFNKNLNAVRDTMSSEIFVNSIPIVDITKSVVKYLLVKSNITNVVDDMLSLRLTSDFIDDAIVVQPTYDLMETLHLNKEC